MFSILCHVYLLIMNQASSRWATHHLLQNCRDKQDPVNMSFTSLVWSFRRQMKRVWLVYPRRWEKTASSTSCGWSSRRTSPPASPWSRTPRTACSTCLKSSSSSNDTTGHKIRPASFPYRCTLKRTSFLLNKSNQSHCVTLWQYITDSFTSDISQTPGLGVKHTPVCLSAVNVTLFQ